nr:MAG TPA: hypothetical protein [Bacteriophage sp.]
MWDFCIICLFTYYLYSESNKSVILTFKAIAIASSCRRVGDVIPFSI